MRRGCHTITWGGVVGSPVGVTSIKDLYYRANGSMDRAMADIAAAGYEGVELFDGNLVDLQERPGGVRGLLRKHDLELVSVYTGGNFIFQEILGEELSRVRTVAEQAARAGAQTLVVGGGAQRSTGRDPQDYERLCAALDQVCEIAEARGLDACYHPHLTTLAESPEQVDAVLQQSRIGFCPDTAHLAAGGGDPAEQIRRYPDRVRHLHLKDFTSEPFGFHPLGQGDLDLPGVVQAARQIGYDGWVMVELDDYDGDPAEAARVSYSALDNLLANQG
ncbi:MAG: sugar phosphate isomerase/epimerase [Ornithinimicrobium sp.]